MALNSASLRLTLASLNEVVGALFVYTRKMSASMDAVLLIVEKEDEKRWRSQKKIVQTVEVEARKARMIMGKLPRVLMIGHPMKDKLVSEGPAMSHEVYLASVMTAANDYILSIKLKEEGGGASTMKGKKRPGSWAALAATGLNPEEFDPEQQRQLVTCIQKDFPDPIALVAMIIENPDDPRLKFESVVEAGGLGLDARVAILEQRLAGCKVVEKRVGTKLKAARRKNAGWKSAIMTSLGVSTKSGEDSDWVDED